jgi:tetratricopeptide (TPR) repeat protein
MSEHQITSARIVSVGWCIAGLIAAGCAAGAPAKTTHAPTTSLAHALPSVESGQPAGPASKPPNPAEGARLFGLALQSLTQGNDAKALQLFEQSAEADPAQAAAHNNLGILYKRAGRLDDAIAAYQQAVARRAGYPEAYYNLALAHRAKGEFKQAETAYLKALELNEQFVDAHYNLGILYDLYLAQPAKALEHYRASLRLNGPNTQEVSRWVAALERIVPPQEPPSTPQPPQPPAPSAAPAASRSASDAPETGPTLEH